MYFVMWIIFVAFLSLCYCQDLPIVELSQGTVIGSKIRSSAASIDYFSFRGIPYAAPPTGDLRFKAPAPALNWSGILDARNDKSACLQPVEPPIPPFSISTSENCLFLNVYTPYLQVPKGKTLLPVMFYIHGGSFRIGSSDSRIYGPDFFMREQVVLVTINYRLGVFGFLNLELPGAQGNVGFKDQLLALKWVQKEIKHFGGDPNSVTIFGNSAGGIAVHFLYLSALSQGLFHKAIAQSGTGHVSKIYDYSNYDKAIKLTTELNCNATSTEAVLSCLKTVDAKDIISAQERISGDYNQIRFGTTIEKNLGEDVFIPESLNELNQRMYSKLPFMVGVNKDEGMYIFTARNVTKEMQDLTRFLRLPAKKITPENISKMTEKLKKKYFDNKPYSNETIKGALQLYTDELLYGTIETVRSLRSRANVYLYHFIFDGKIKHIDRAPLLKELNITGASHTDELGYLFYSENLNQSITEETDEAATILRVVRMWTNFAKHGNPTPDSSDQTLKGIVWQPVSKTNTRHLQIGKELNMINTDLEPERTTFFDNLYPESEIPSGTATLQCSFSVVYFTLIMIIIQLYYKHI